MERFSRFEMPMEGAHPDLFFLVFASLQFHPLESFFLQAYTGSILDHRVGSFFLFSVVFVGASVAFFGFCFFWVLFFASPPQTTNSRDSRLVKDGSKWPLCFLRGLSCFLPSPNTLLGIFILAPQVSARSASGTSEFG